MCAHPLTCGCNFFRWNDTNERLEGPPMATRIFFAFTLAAALVACGGDDNGGGGGDGDSSVNDDADTTIIDGAAGDGGIIVGGDGGTWECHVTSCNNHTLQCGDCVDNDGDGEIDSHDRECL